MSTSTQGAAPATGRPAPEVDRGGIGWIRALLSGIALVLLGFLGAAVVPNLLLSRLSVGRDLKATIAATVSLLAVVVVAWLARRLQARGLI